MHEISRCQRMPWRFTSYGGDNVRASEQANERTHIYILRGHASRSRARYHIVTSQIDLDAKATRTLKLSFCHSCQANAFRMHDDVNFSSFCVCARGWREEKRKIDKVQLRILTLFGNNSFFLFFFYF